MQSGLPPMRAFLLLTLLPWALMLSVFFLRTGRDLTVPFVIGCGLLAVTGIASLGLGFRKSRYDVFLGGIGLLASLSICLLGSGGFWWVGSKTLTIVVDVQDEETVR